MHRLRDAQRDDLRVGDHAPGVLGRLGQEIVGRAENGNQQQVEVGVHRGPLGRRRELSTADFDLLRYVSYSTTPTGRGITHLGLCAGSSPDVTSGSSGSSGSSASMRYSVRRASLSTWRACSTWASSRPSRPARRRVELPQEAHELDAALADLAADVGPRLAEAPAVLVDVGAARVGELELLAPVALRADEALVLEQGEGGVDRAGLGRQTPSLRCSISCIRP